MRKMTKLLAVAAFSLTAYQQMIVASCQRDWNSANYQDGRFDQDFSYSRAGERDDRGNGQGYYQGNEGYNQMDNRYPMDQSGYRGMREEELTREGQPDYRYDRRAIREERRDERHVRQDERRILRDERRLERDERRMARDDFRQMRDERRMNQGERRFDNRQNIPSDQDQRGYAGNNEAENDQADRDHVNSHYNSPEATPRSYPLSDGRPVNRSNPGYHQGQNFQGNSSYNRSGYNENGRNGQENQYSQTDQDDNQDEQDDANYQNEAAPRSYPLSNDDQNSDNRSNNRQNRSENRSSYNSANYRDDYRSRQLISDATLPSTLNNASTNNSGSTTTQTREKHSADSAKTQETILLVISKNPSLSTFAQAIQASELVKTLSSKGPFTIFAPDNQAFKKMPAAQLQELLKPENKQKLTALLNHHVITGKVMAADVKEGKVKTANGKELAIKKNGSKVTVNGATITRTDLVGSNGVIHIVDTVLVP